MLGLVIDFTALPISNLTQIQMMDILFHGAELVKKSQLFMGIGKKRKFHLITTKAIAVSK
jgi:hypothetical protein